MKDSFSQIAKFWWGIIIFRFIPTAEDNILGDDKAVFVASLISGFSLNFGNNCR